MAPRQRSSKAGSSKPERKKPADSKDDPSRPSTVHAQPPTPEQNAKKKGVKCSPLLKRIGLFALILAIPAILNYAALNQEARVLMPKGGMMYDIGWEQKLFMRCEGEGRPTVILDAPIGQSSIIWFRVQPLIAKHTKVCVYDRAGLGFSHRAYRNTSEYANDFSPAAIDRDRTQPSTVERMADDLHRLISYSSNQPKPVILVSSDFMTLVSRFYTQLYEHEVAGLFLIDPAIENLFDASPDSVPEKPEVERNDDQHSRPVNWTSYWYRGVVPHMQSIRLMAAVGFTRVALMLRLMSPVEEPKLKKILPEEIVTMKKHFLCNPSHLSSRVDEYYFMNESMNQLRTVYQVKPFPSDLPITIAMYREQNENLPSELREVWAEGHKKLLHSIHPRSKLVVLPGVDYLTYFYNPESLANAIIPMVDRWRREASAQL